MVLLTITFDWSANISDRERVRIWGRLCNLTKDNNTRDFSAPVSNSNLWELRLKEKGYESKVHLFLFEEEEEETEKEEEEKTEM